jgi:hypothetical protein
MLGLQASSQNLHIVDTPKRLGRRWRLRLVDHLVQDRKSAAPACYGFGCGGVRPRRVANTLLDMGDAHFVLYVEHSLFCCGALPRVLISSLM